jgi:ABC-2 type transport system ATP-binding protein
LDGRPLKHFSQRNSFGYLPELPYFYDHLTVEETLTYLGALALRRSSSLELKKRVLQTLEKVGLVDRRLSKVRTLSKGLQQRLGLAQAIINHPDFLLLDEPFSGLDPLGRAEFRKIIQELNLAGTTVIISSHILSDIQQLSNRVAILAGGEVRHTFSLADRAQLFGERKFIRFLSESEPEDTLTARAQRVSHSRTYNGQEFTLTFEEQLSAAEALQSIIQKQAAGVCTLLEYRSEPKDLEEIFLEVTKAR